MTLPTIHLNGTGPDTLLEGYLGAYRALDAADAALRSVEFNARDYYVQGPSAFQAAQAERLQQFEAINKVKRELMRIIEHVQDAIDARRAQRQSREGGA